MPEWYEDESTFDVLTFGDDEAEPKPVNVRRRLAVGGAAAVIGGFGLGGYLLYGALASSGPQPDTVVPSGAAVYASVDLDPAAGQKVAAVRFLHEFPALRKTLGDNGDVGGSLVKSVFTDTSVSYAKDIKPWIGSRFALALVPDVDGHKLTYELAAQVKDDAAARRLLPKLAAIAKKSNAENADEVDYSGAPPGFADLDFLDLSPAGWVIQNGYAIMAPTQGIADALGKAALVNDLAGAPAYAADVHGLGNRVATLWQDGSAFPKSDAAAVSALRSIQFLAVPGLDLRGRTALGLKFTSSAAEVVGTTTEPVGGGSERTTQLATLPASTMVGVEVAGGAGTIMQTWKTYHSFIESFAEYSSEGDGVSTHESPSVLANWKQQFGLTLPDDVATVFGTDTLVGWGMPADHGQPVSVRTVVPADKQLTVNITKLLGALNQQAARRTPDGYAWTNNPPYDVQVGSGGLGASAEFKAAVPDAAKATWALYVDWAKVAAATHDDGTISHLGTLGITEVPDGDQTKVFVRLTGR